MNDNDNPIVNNRRLEAGVTVVPASCRQPGALRIRNCGRLPHWERSGTACFVTFRLYDSVPKAVVEAYLFERQNIIKTAEQLKRPLTDVEQRRLMTLYSKNIETHLDQGTGHCFLRHQPVAQLIQDSLEYFNGERYQLHTQCVMPNHVHVVFELLEGYSLEKTLHSWKSYTATKANKLLNRSGIFWQKEYFDHLIRNEVSFERIVKYVLENPKKAGLKNWPWTKAYE